MESRWIDALGGGTDAVFASFRPPDYPSDLQRDLWFMVVHGIDCDRYMETLAFEGAYHGFEYRAPLYDVRLIRFMLDVPFEWRIPHGRFKAFLVDGLGDVLPPEIASRNSKTSRYQYNAVTLKSWREELLGILFGKAPWYSEAFVNRDRAQNYIRGLDLDRPVSGIDYDRAKRIDLAWRIAAAELWLRSLNGGLTSDSPLAA
jgi:hypothetical protein